MASPWDSDTNTDSNVYSNHDTYLNANGYSGTPGAYVD
jgi:hypothetical protein